MLVSRAGDWTSELIDHPPTQVWVRGIPTVGVANVRKLFTKVVLVATGSAGSGPCWVICWTPLFPPGWSG